MASYAIETDGLSRSFGAVQALDGLSLRVRSGQVFGYLGPNGAGKTTTLHLLLGILAPTAGSASVAGVDVASRPDEVRRRCGALLEHNGLYERLTALENLQFHGRIRGMDRAALAQRCEQVLEGMGLWDRRDERVGTWSRGMKQQLAIGRALLHRPEVLFLDEPTAGFDPAAAAKLRRSLAAIVKESGMTVFLTTHNLHEAEELCHEVAVIRKGRLVATGPPGSLGARAKSEVLELHGTGFTRPLVASLEKRAEVERVELRDGTLLVSLKGGSKAAGLVAAAVQAGARLEEVRRQRASLEESFLSILEAPE
jgi:ABC-2 type transport system ATP-binding protein